MIYDLIQLSRHDIDTNAPLLAAASCFWSTALNAFVFEFGTLTLYDLSVLFGLKPHGQELDPALQIDTSLFDSIIIKSTDYGPFLSAKQGTVTQEEHVAFLLLWMGIQSNFICSASPFDSWEI